MAGLTYQERAKVREAEVLKDSIREDLLATRKRSRVSSGFEHPAVLLLLGFFLTGVVGTGLTYFWKSRESENQQHYLAKQRALEKKYAVIDEAFKAVAETNTAAEDILALYSWTWDEKEVKQRQDAWFTSSRSWRVSSKIVRQKLGTYFSNTAVQAKFDEIIRVRKLAGNAITNLLKGGVKSEEEGEMQTSVRDLVNQTGELLKECGHLMAYELVQR